ncbi:MAG: type II toxin-antitoxin system Phd/YefM family antitoxin [Candidatus Roizmanbacteria bacterium]|nr:MAG: type II toxin-antitoxin system Phd/YefM family antitoxin [Candidatus Roizmanbacteria bacterium]
MTNFISPRDLQRSSKKILEEVNKTKKPAIILSKKKPVGVIITYKFFEKMTSQSRLEKVFAEALKESKSGKTKVIDTPEKLKKDLEELEKYINDKD